MDDEIDIRMLWRLVFQFHGGFGAIAEAADGREALERLEAECFDVVVTDFSLPDISGFEVIGETRSRWPSALVIMVSGTADVGDEALRLGASAFFDKRDSTSVLMPQFVSALLAEQEALALTGSGGRTLADLFASGDQVPTH